MTIQIKEEQLLFMSSDQRNIYVNIKNKRKKVFLTFLFILLISLGIRFIQIGRMINNISHSKFFIENISINKNNRGLCNLTVDLDVNSEANLSLSKIQIDLICKSQGESIVFAKFKCNDLKLIKKEKISFNACISVDYMDIPRLMAVKGPKKYYISYKVLLQIRILLVKLAFAINRSLELERRHSTVNNNEFIVSSLSKKVIDHSFKRIYVNEAGYYQIVLKVDDLINKEYVGNIDFFFEDLLIGFYSPNKMKFIVNKIKVDTDSCMVDILIPIKEFSRFIIDSLSEYWKTGKIDIQIDRITDRSCNKSDDVTGHAKDGTVIYDRDADMNILRIILPFGYQRSTKMKKKIENIKISKDEVSADFTVESSTILLTFRDILRKLFDKVMIRSLLYFNEEYLCDIFIKIPEESYEKIKYGTSFSLMRFIIRFNEMSNLVICKSSPFKGMTVRFKIEILGEKNSDTEYEMSWIEKMKVGISKDSPPILFYKALQIPLFSNGSQNTTYRNVIEHWTLPIENDEIFNIQSLITNRTGNKSDKSNLSIEVPSMILSLHNGSNDKALLKTEMCNNSFLESVDASFYYYFNLKTSLFSLNDILSLLNKDKGAFYLKIQDLINIQITVSFEKENSPSTLTVFDLNFNNLDIHSLNSFRLNVTSDNENVLDYSPIIINRIRILNPGIQYKNMVYIDSNSHVDLEIVTCSNCNIIRLRKAVDFTVSLFSNDKGVNNNGQHKDCGKSHVSALFDYAINNDQINNSNINNTPAVDIFDGLAVIKAKLSDCNDKLDFSMSISIPEDMIKIKFDKTVLLLVKPQYNLRIVNDDSSLSFEMGISPDDDKYGNDVKYRKIFLSVKGGFKRNHESFNLSFFVDNKLKEKKTVTSKAISDFFRMSLPTSNTLPLDNKMKRKSLNNIIHVEPLFFQSISSNQIKAFIKLYTDKFDLVIRRILNQFILLKKVPSHINLDLNISRIPSVFLMVPYEDGEIKWIELKDITIKVSNMIFKPCYTKDKYTLLSTRALLNELYNMDQSKTDHYMETTNCSSLDSRIFDMPIGVNFVLKIEDMEYIEECLGNYISTNDMHISLGPSVIQNFIYTFINTNNKNISRYGIQKKDKTIDDESEVTRFYISRKLFEYALIAKKFNFILNFIKKPVSVVLIATNKFGGCFRFFGLQTDKGILQDNFDMSFQLMPFEKKDINNIFEKEFEKYCGSSAEKYKVIGLKAFVVFEEKLIPVTVYIPNFYNLYILYYYLNHQATKGTLKVFGLKNSLFLLEKFKDFQGIITWSSENSKSPVKLINYDDFGVLYRKFDEEEMKKAKALSI